MSDTPHHAIVIDGKCYGYYRKTAEKLMRPYVDGESLDGVSVAECDTPELGGMVAISPDNHADKWYVAKKFFDDNYEEA